MWGRRETSKGISSPLFGDDLTQSRWITCVHFENFFDMFVHKSFPVCVRTHADSLNGPTPTALSQLSGSRAPRWQLGGQEESIAGCYKSRLLASMSTRERTNPNPLQED